MADFATLGEAMLPAMNRQPGAFVDAMIRNQERQNAIILEAHPEAIELLKWTQNRIDARYEGTASDLLTSLTGFADVGTTRSKSWPKTAKALSVSLRRLAPNLKQAGLAITFTRDKHTRAIHIDRLETIGDSPSPASSASSGDAGDADDARFPIVSTVTTNGASWKCPDCGASNAAHVTTCFGCILARQSEQPQPVDDVEMFR